MSKLTGNRWAGTSLVLVALAAAYFVPRTTFVRQHRFGFIASCVVLIVVMVVAELITLIRERNTRRRQAGLSQTTKSARDHALAEGGNLAEAGDLSEVE